MNNIFGQPILWRDTARTPRLAIFDARLVFFLFLLALHLRLWTLILLVLAIIAFWAIERYGYVLPNALRAIRSAFAGHRRPAHAGHRYRVAVDYGFEALMPRPAATTSQETAHAPQLQEAPST